MFSPSIAKNRRIIAIILSVICLCGLCGCSSGASDSADAPAGLESGRTDEFQETANALYQECLMRPETLAATISAFPQKLQQIDIENSDPIYLDDLLDGENGGDVQLAMLGLLKEILEDSGVSLAFLKKWSGQADLLCVGRRDPEAPDSPSNTGLYWSETELKDERIFVVSIEASSAQYESAYFLIEDGNFQRVVPKFS